MDNITLGGAISAAGLLTLFHLTHVLKSERPKRKNPIYIAIGGKAMYSDDGYRKLDLECKTAYHREIIKYCIVYLSPFVFSTFALIFLLLFILEIGLFILILSLLSTMISVIYQKWIS